MHGRRSIIKRRDDDDITMTRPLNKRVSFSANNYTRLFQVDSDESTRHTNLDSTGQQSTMSLMEHTMTHTISARHLSEPSSAEAMETTHLEDIADGFDWMSEDVETDPNPPTGIEEPDETKDPAQKQPNLKTAIQHSLDNDDKTRPVELRKEQTDSVKDEVLKVASNLLKPARSSDETRSALDIFGIQATLNSRTGRQEKAESINELDVSGTPVMREHAASDDVLDVTNPGNQSQREITLATSESWFEVTGVINLDQNEESFVLECSEHCPSPRVGALEDSKKLLLQDETLGEDADPDESQQSNRLAMSRDSLVRPAFGTDFEEKSEAESEDDVVEEAFGETAEPRNSQSRRSMMIETRNETMDQSDSAAPEPLSPCLEVDSIRSERRTFVVPPPDSTMINSSRRSSDKSPTNCDELFSRRRTFDKSPTESSQLQTRRRTYELPTANETYSVLDSTQARKTSDMEISSLSGEPEPSLFQHATSPILHPGDRSTNRACEKPAAQRSLEEWIQLDPDLFSVFAEPLIEHAPIPREEGTVKQIVELDEERLKKALTLEEDEELNAFIRNERKVMQEILAAQRELISELDAQLIRETTVLFDDLPFYRAFSATKFKISSDPGSKVVSAWYRYCSIPCVLIECREENDGVVKVCAQAIEIPTSVCPLASYVDWWIKNALGGRNSFTAKCWSEAQSKVISAFEVIDVSFDAFESVKCRLLWCDERKRVFLKMLWRSRVIRAYIGADLDEELVPEDSPTNLSFRGEDLRAAWKNDGISTYRDRINKVHRRNLEIAAEEMMEAAKF